MSDSSSSRQNTGASVEANPSDSSTNKQTEAVQTQGSNQDAQDANTATKEDDAPVREPVQLKSHFKGMPKDWPINKSEQLPVSPSRKLLTNLAQKDKDQ